LISFLFSSLLRGGKGKVRGGAFWGLKDLEGWEGLREKENGRMFELRGVVASRWEKKDYKSEGKFLWAESREGVK
jgi:hypothetical protein